MSRFISVNLKSVNSKKAFFDAKLDQLEIEEAVLIPFVFINCENWTDNGCRFICQKEAAYAVHYDLIAESEVEVMIEHNESFQERSFISGKGRLSKSMIIKLNKDDRISLCVTSKGVLKGLYMYVHEI